MVALKLKIHENQQYVLYRPYNYGLLFMNSLMFFSLVLIIFIMFNIFAGTFSVIDIFGNIYVIFILLVSSFLLFFKANQSESLFLDVKNRIIIVKKTSIIINETNTFVVKQENNITDSGFPCYWTIFLVQNGLEFKLMRVGGFNEKEYTTIELIIKHLAELFKLEFTLIKI
jgi:hypothetical protein